MKMKQEHLVLLVSFAFTLVIATSYALACTTPTDDLIINSDTTLCGGSYSITDGGALNGVIVINTNNISLDCNNSYIYGNNAGFGIWVENQNNVTISNCNTSNYNSGIRIISNSKNITVKESYIFNNKNGIYIDSSENISIINNTIINNLDAALYAGAITLYNNVNNSVIINNTLKSNTRGIYLRTSGNYNNILSNKIRENTNNIEIDTAVKFTLIDTNVLEPGTTYGGTSTTSLNNIFAHVTAGPPTNFLSDYATITEALTASSPSDIIYAFSKTYSECVSITKAITLIGEERDTTEISCSGSSALNITQSSSKAKNLTLSATDPSYPALLVNADSTEISNISIKNVYFGASVVGSQDSILDYLYLENTTYGINITSSVNTTVKRGAITNTSAALSLNNTTGTKITETTLTDTSGPTAVILENSTSDNITSNAFVNGNTAIALKETSQSLIKGNTFTGYTKKAIELETASEDNSIQDNTITGAPEYGIYLGTAALTLIRNNTISYAENGIFLYQSSNNTLENNTVSHATNTSITLKESQGNNITENTLKNSTTEGISIGTSSTNNSLWMNNFTDTSNTFNANNNQYCVMGLDNYYASSVPDTVPYSCYRSFQSSFNDTVININDTILFSADTSLGKSNHTTVNVTINSTNYTTSLATGNSINGIWTYIFKDTLVPGIYSATQLYYYEADDDEGIYTLSATSFRVLDKLRITTDITPKTANVTDTVTITATVENNASEIQYVKSQIYWNNTLVDTKTKTSGSMINSSATRYTLYTTATSRSGAYTVNTTVVTDRNMTYEDTFSINYGKAQVTISATPSGMNNGTSKPQYINITATEGDLKNTSITYVSSNTSRINITNGSQAIAYINSSASWQIYINLTANKKGTAQITVNATPENGTEGSASKNITVKELVLNTALGTGTINTTDTIQLKANITGNVTAISYVTANITWNSTSTQNITLSFDRYYPSEEKYAYKSIITETVRSGNYTALIKAKADISQNTTEKFFVNYGHAGIIFSPDPRSMNISDNRTQEITIVAMQGDLANITLKLTSENESILNLSTGENPVRTIPSILYTENERDISKYNLTGIALGSANITANVTSPYSATATAKKSINITNTGDTSNPTVTAIWTNSSINKYNLLDNAKIYANMSDDSGFKTRLAEITKPDSYSKNYTMTWTGTGETYYTEYPFTNTTQEGNYTIKIHAIDYSGNTNSTETKNFTVTATYPKAAIDTYNLYNRGENATITVSVYDVNNNEITVFNTSLNITHGPNTTVLLENNETDTYTYYINTSVLGLHTLDVNVTKNGNTASNTSTFNVTDTYNLMFIVPDETALPTPGPSELIPQVFIEAQDPRNSHLEKTVSVAITCYNDTYETQTNITMSKNYYYEYSGSQKCYTAAGYSRQFSITAQSSDNSNNTATKTIYITTEPYGQGSSSSTSTSTSSSGGPSVLPSITEKIKEIFIGDNETANDFTFSLNKKEINLRQGEKTTIIGTINNIGKLHQLIKLTLTKQCCDIRIDNTTYEIAGKNKKDFPIGIHNSLKSAPGEYLVTITMSSGNITKTETLKIIIDRNPLFDTQKHLEENVGELEKNIEEHRLAGIDTSHLEDALDEYKKELIKARESIEKDDLETFTISVNNAESRSNYIELGLAGLNIQKWLLENKYNITTAIIIIIISAYLLIYFIIPFYYMRIELKKLTTKELELRDAEKTVQKQYFMRQLDEPTFNRLISEKHSQLLDIRSQIKRIEEKVTLLKRGKLDLKDKEHRKYFILNRFARKKEKKKEKESLNVEDRLKELSEQEYNIAQSTKEAEKNYYSRIITEQELEQIISNNHEKIESIKKERETIKKNHRPHEKERIKKRGPGILARIKKKLILHSIQKEKLKTEKKIHELEMHEQDLEKKDHEIKEKEDETKKHIDELKSYKNDLAEKEKETTGTESPRPQEKQQKQESGQK